MKQQSAEFARLNCLTSHLQCYLRSVKTGRSASLPGSQRSLGEATVESIPRWLGIRPCSRARNGSRFADTPATRFDFCPLLPQTRAHEPCRSTSFFRVRSSPRSPRRASAPRRWIFPRVES